MTADQNTWADLQESMSEEIAEGGDASTLVIVVKNWILELPALSNEWLSLHQYEHFDEDERDMGPCILVSDLRAARDAPGDAAQAAPQVDAGVEDVLNRWSAGPAIVQMVVAEVRGALAARDTPGDAAQVSAAAESDALPVTRAVNDAVGWDDRKTLADLWQDHARLPEVGLTEEVYSALIAVAQWGARAVAEEFADRPAQLAPQVDEGAAQRARAALDAEGYTGLDDEVIDIVLAAARDDAAPAGRSVTVRAEPVEEVCDHESGRCCDIRHQSIGGSADREWFAAQRRSPKPGTGETR